MRVSADATLPEVFAKMTVRQQQAMVALREGRVELARAEAVVASAQATLAADVHWALEAKVPARIVAEELGITQSRVYQIRDEVAAHRAGAA